MATDITTMTADELFTKAHDWLGKAIKYEDEGKSESFVIKVLDKAKKSLDSIAQYLKDQTTQQIRIDGHTDGVPIKFSGWMDNYHLSAMRAHAVMKYLKARGISDERMYIAGFGANRPMVQPKKKTDPVGKNRRVEILLVAETGGNIEEILKKFQP